MKYFSLAILALVCVTVATAAPSDSLEELAFNPLEGIKNKLKEIFEKFQCTRDVIGEAVINSDFEKDYEEFKKIVDTVMVDFKKCSKVQSKKEQFQCTLKVLKELPEYFTNFFEKMNKKNEKLAKEIRKKVVSKCFKSQEMPQLIEETFAPSFEEQFQCISDVLGSVSKANGLEETWSRTQPLMQRHIDNMKGCPNLGNKFLVAACYIRETIAFFRDFTEYVQLVAAENPKVLKDFIREVNLKCAGGVRFEELMLSSKKVGNTFKCMAEGIREAVKGTDYEGLFEGIKEDMDKVGDHIRACKSESNKMEAAKCVMHEIKRAIKKISEFLRNLDETNHDAATRARHNLRKCLN